MEYIIASNIMIIVFHIAILAFEICTVGYTAKTRSDRDFEMNLCYTPKAFSCLEETKYNINHCLELAPSFPKMYNITMF